MNEPLSHYLRTLSDPEIPVGLSDVERLMKEYPFSPFRLSPSCSAKAALFRPKPAAGCSDR